MNEGIKLTENIRECKKILHEMLKVSPEYMSLGQVDFSCLCEVLDNLDWNVELHSMDWGNDSYYINAQDDKGVNYIIQVNIIPGRINIYKK